MKTAKLVSQSDCFGAKQHYFNQLQIMSKEVRDEGRNNRVQMRKLKVCSVSKYYGRRWGFVLRFFFYIISH